MLVPPVGTGRMRATGQYAADEEMGGFHKLSGPRCVDFENCSVFAFVTNCNVQYSLDTLAFVD